MARTTRAARLWLLTLVVALGAQQEAAAQQPARFDGTIQSIDGQTLTMLSDAPINRGRATLSLSLEAVPAPRPVLTIDVSQIRASEYVFLREGQRVTVFGVLSQDGRRVIATSIPGTGRPPEAP
jgi:hypothetical protein